MRNLSGVSVNYDIEGVGKKDAKRILRGRYFFSSPNKSSIRNFLEYNKIYPYTLDSNRDKINTCTILNDDLQYTFNLLLSVGMDIVRVKPSGVKKTLNAKEIEKMRILMSNGKDEELKKRFSESLHDL